MPRNSYLRQLAQRSRPVGDLRFAADAESQSKRKVNELPILHPIRPLFRQWEAQQPLEMEEEAAFSQELTAAQVTQPKVLNQGTESIAVPSVLQHREKFSSASSHPVADLPVVSVIAPESRATKTPDVPHSTINPTTSPTATDLPPSTASIEQNLLTETISARPKITSVPSIARNLSSVSAAHLEPLISTKRLEEQAPQMHSVTKSATKPDATAIVPQPRSPESVVIASSSTKINQPVRSTLEPIHNPQPGQTGSIPVPPPRHSKTRTKSTIHIGAIDIQITPPPVVMPQPAPRAAPPPTTPLSRGFGSSFGLRQG